MATEEDKTTEQEEEETTTLSSPSLAALAPQTFSLEDITETYNLLANQPQDYADALMQRQGTAQASYGPLAEQAMGQSRTPEGGVGNYTYNRLIRPSVDTMRDEMIVKGLSDALNKQISDSLKKAQNEYNKKSRSGKSGGSSPSTTSNTGAWDGEFEEENKEKTNIPGQDYNAEDYINSSYTFSNYGNLPGMDNRKYPYLVDGPVSTSYEVYTAGESDPFKKGKMWVDYLYKLGYAG